MNDKREHRAGEAGRPAVATAEVDAARGAPRMAWEMDTRQPWDQLADPMPNGDPAAVILWGSEESA